MDTVDYEGLYLGRIVDAEGQVTGTPVLYPSRHLRTHALLLGATGSGKTGLGLVMVEECLRKRIPALLLDVKGDLSNLLLTFPELDAASFAPWVDADAAEREGKSVSEAAEEAATLWRRGLEKWGLGSQDLQALRQGAALQIYTPGLRSGRPINILMRFDSPSGDDPDESAARAQSLTSALLSLAGVEADPLHSREHILLTTLIRHNWETRGTLDVPLLIQQIQQPPVDHIGVFDIESFFPQKERFELALQLNSLIAAPGFASWREGEPLDIDHLLFTDEGQPRATIFYLAHLPEEQRRFFLTLFLEELHAWVRRQPGTRALRAMLFFDEVYGYLPPHPYNPPTKTPLLSLVKQGRSAGFGVVLSTQNPADLDYKGLGNIGTWFVGALRTERDKQRVMEGMEGTIVSSGQKVSDIEAAIGRLRSRVFLLHDAREGTLEFFHSRWAMSYLRGPLTTAEVRKLIPEAPVESRPVSPITGRIAQPSPTPRTVAAVVAASAPTRTPSQGTGESVLRQPPAVDPAIPQAFLPATITANWAARNAGLSATDAQSARLLYRPYLLGIGIARIYNQRAGVSLTDEQAWRVPPSSERWALRWDQGEQVDVSSKDLLPRPPAEAFYEPLPRAMARKSDYPKWESALKTHIYHQTQITIWASRKLKLYSKPDESKRAFLDRCAREIERRKKADLDKARAKLESQIERLETKIRKEELELERDEDRLQARRREEIASGAESVLSMLTRRRLRSRALSQTTRQRRYVKDAKAEVEESVEAIKMYEEQLEELRASWEGIEQQIASEWNAVLDEIQEIIIKAKRTDIDVRFCGLVWFPFWEFTTGDGVRRIAAYVPQS